MASYPDLRRSRTASLPGIALAILASLTLPGRPARAEYAFEVAKSFDRLPEGVNSELVAGSDGFLYGTSSGTIFRVDTTGAVSILHAFDFEDEGYPSGNRLTLRDGTLYGSTLSAYHNGTTFKLDSTGVFSVLRAETCTLLAVGADGALYAQCGYTLFAIDSEDEFHALETFPPVGGGLITLSLTPASDGALYGVAREVCCGIGAFVFRVDGAGTVTPIYYFTNSDGEAAKSALTLGSDGALYGTTRATWEQPPATNAGTVFRIDTAGNFRTIHTFSGTDGISPFGLTLGGDGALYGFTSWGGASLNNGTLFRIDGAGNFVTLHSFDSAAPFWPDKRDLTAGPNGGIYGTTGTTLFRVDSEGTFSVIHSFPGWPRFSPHYSSSLTLGVDGALYGVESGWGDDEGVSCGGLGSVFRIDDDGKFTSLRSFERSTDGSIPGALVAGTDGALYGTTTSEGSGCGGTVFRLDGTGAFQSLVSLPLHGGPVELVAGNGGLVYGSLNDPAPSGGCSSGEGVVPSPGYVFSVDPSGNYSVVRSFDCGAPIVGPLTAGADGAIWGTVSGYQSSTSTVFRIDSAGAFAFSPACDNSGSCGPPIAGLVAGSDGAMYGTTLGGGSSNLGTIFRIDASGAYSVLHSFSGSDGSYPRAALVLGRDGALYGPTQRGGSSDLGTIFRVLPSGEFESVHAFSGADGARPFTALVRGADGALYGTAPERGPGGGGVVYRLFAPLPQTIVFDPLPDRSLGDAPFTVTATSSSGLPVSFSASGSCAVAGDQVTLTGGGLCTLTASQPGDADYEAAPDVSQSFDVSFDFTGFLRPVMNPPVVNRVTAGRVVPIRFSLGGDAGDDVLAAGSPAVRRVPCNSELPVNSVDGIAANPGSLRHASGTDRYGYAWQTDPSWGGTCRELSLELVDGSVHRAIFQFGRRPRPRGGSGQGQ